MKDSSITFNQQVTLAITNLKKNLDKFHINLKSLAQAYSLIDRRVSKVELLLNLKDTQIKDLTTRVEKMEETINQMVSGDSNSLADEAPTVIIKHADRFRD